MLVVVLIIGILAAVALPQNQKVVEKARLSEATSMLKKLERGTDLWVLENGYPSSSIQFLGTSPKAQLPFVIEGTKQGNRVKTNYFGYTTYCGANYCDHIADRVVDEIEVYRLFQRKHATGSYTRQCEVRDKNNNAAHIACDEMKKQGWPKIVK